ncbi:PREDICTED: yae1 domain-containing protein 1 [Dipodomys ordii]|uniref:Yae1 domain-containing protein 1 n=1 Tax=Dipodomys ordii TaxID=10020 RepID=A0A1S3GIC6_DIPOR|nr:PREDICTED: yae1 domain-containing protein 1 [Dipodomys ordii]
MSWVRVQPVASGPGEPGDVFDEEADESVLLQREWRNHMQRRVQEGYRDGVDAGKAVALQQGFNQGYKEGAEVIVNYGQIRGTLSALLSWCHLHTHSVIWINKIHALLDALGQCEECVLQRLKAIAAGPQVGDLLDSIEGMDLGHTVQAKEKIAEVTDARLCENGAEWNQNGDKTVDGVEGSHLECHRTQEHPRLEPPSLTWVLEQTATLVTQLGVPVDILQHLKQL